ncbi:hypothetical protein QBZ16_002593 [Prototheca wickerhamii]|uniref:Peptidase S8/S53 domain-containing protein n=1 Tax=Prototheca wickerhamii TaxID=3111 RepID=A0AAD9MLZ0_PROWI|nr:hypothetical protein QBZ16_002593 [Prototheca wickerhamii]
MCSVSASSGPSSTSGELSLASLSAASPPPPADSTQPQDDWIVQWRDGSTATDAACEAAGGCSQRFRRALSGAALRLARANLSSFLLAHRDEVAAVYADSEIRVGSMEVQDLGSSSAQLALGASSWSGLWGLDRLDQSSLPMDGLYHYEADGAGVTAYIIDSGVRASHEQFRASGGGASRASEAFTSLSSGTPGEDCQGHGTHVAGVVGGLTFGVAKGITLRALRVLNCDGTGLVSGAIAALDWLLENGSRPAVVTMSMAGAVSQALDDAVSAVVDAGFVVAVAAGNGDADACEVSPARTAAALTVGASDGNDRRLFYKAGSASNYGACVDIFAPGTNIQSAGISSDSATAYRTGTSQAAPFVAGAAALRLQGAPDTSPADGKLQPPEDSSWTFEGSGTSNLLVQSLWSTPSGAPSPSGSASPATAWSAPTAAATSTSPGEQAFASLPPPSTNKTAAASPTLAGDADALSGGASPTPSPPPADSSVVPIPGSDLQWALSAWGACEASSCLQERDVACQTVNGTAAAEAACQGYAVLAGEAEPAAYQACCDGTDVEGSSDGLGSGAITAIVVGSLAGVALLALVVVGAVYVARAVPPEDVALRERYQPAGPAFVPGTQT